MDSLYGSRDAKERERETRYQVTEKYYSKEESPSLMQIYWQRKIFLSRMYTYRLFFANISALQATRRTSLSLLQISRTSRARLKLEHVAQVYTCIQKAAAARWYSIPRRKHAHSRKKISKKKEREIRIEKHIYINGETHSCVQSKAAINLSSI